MSQSRPLDLRGRPGSIEADRESPLLGSDGVRTGLGVYGTVVLACLVVGR